MSYNANELRFNQFKKSFNKQTIITNKNDDMLILNNLDSNHKSDGI